MSRYSSALRSRSASSPDHVAPGVVVGRVDKGRQADRVDVAEQHLVGAGFEGLGVDGHPVGQPCPGRLWHRQHRTPLFTPWDQAVARICRTP